MNSTSLNFVPLNFELTAQEKEKIEKIQEKMNLDLLENKIFPNAENLDYNFLKTQFRAMISTFIDETKLIYKNAHERALKYYAEHYDELISQLKQEVKEEAALINYTEQGANKKLSAIGIQKYKKNIELELAPYLEILKSNTPKDYEEIISFIDYALEHREEFFQEEHETIQKKSSTPIKTRTIRSKELKLDRSKPNKAIRDGQEELYSTKGLYVETGHKKNKPIYTPVLLNFVNEELEKQGLSIDGIGHLDAFDAEILMHAESLYEAGNKIITVDMITSQIAGGNRRVQTTPKMKEEIYKSLKRLRLTNITINTENEQKVGYNKHIIFSGALLPNKIESEPAIINGKRIEEYIHIFDASPLSKYADSKNQISRPPVNMLDVSASLTRENVILVGYLARRIVDMQSPDEWRGKYIIRYDTIFEYMKIEDKNDNTTKTTKKRIRQTVRTILEEWKKKGIIKDFQELGEDNKPPKSRAPIAKIKITMPQKEIEANKNQ